MAPDQLPGHFAGGSPRSPCLGGPLLRGLWLPLSRPGEGATQTCFLTAQQTPKTVSWAQAQISQVESGGSWMGKPGAGPSRVAAPPPLCRDPQGQAAQLGWDWGRGACLPQRPRHGARGWGQWGRPLQEPRAPTQEQTQPLRPSRLPREPRAAFVGGAEQVGPRHRLCSAPSMDEEGTQERPCRGTPAEQEAGPASACLWLAWGSRGHAGPTLGASRRSRQSAAESGGLNQDGHAARRGQSCAVGSRPGACGDLGAQGLRQE